MYERLHTMTGAQGSARFVSHSRLLSMPLCRAVARIAIVKPDKAREVGDMLSQAT